MLYPIELGVQKRHKSRCSYGLHHAAWRPMGVGVPGDFWPNPPQ